MSLRSYTFIGGSNGDIAGNSVASAGDVDGDGLDDILIGAPNADNGGTGTSLAYLLTASDLAAADAADGTVDGVIDLENVDEQSSSYFFTGGPPSLNGLTVSPAGDVDGDGLDDLFFGEATASGGGPGSGEAFLLTAADLADADAQDGSTDGTISLSSVSGQASSYRFVGEDPTDRAGFSVSSAGDIDGDGLDDLLIGAPDATGPVGASLSGAAYLVTADDLAAADAADGSVDGVIDLGFIDDQAGSYLFVGEGLNFDAGASLSSIGDIDGDGLDDLVIGSPLADMGGDARNGATYVVSGSSLAAADAADGSADGVIDLGNVAAQSGSYAFIGDETLDFTGFSVSSAGDVDGDGVDDLLIGSSDGTDGSPLEGISYLVSSADFAAADAADGTSDGIIDLGLVADQANSYAFVGVNVTDRAGIEVTTAGDVDGDGLDDLLIGSEGDVSYLISAADLEDADAADGTVDGVIDLSNIAGLDNSYEIVAGTGLDNAGEAVSAAGDVDGDGFADLLIGAPGSSTGGAYLLSGRDLAAADDDGTGQDGVINLGNIFIDEVVEGTSGNDLIDTNYLADPELDRVDNNDNAAGNNDDVIQAGDGDDTIVGSEGDDDINGGTGQDTYVSGQSINSYTFIGTEAFDAAGTAVSSAGDISGDGLDDIFISAEGADGGGPVSGEVYLLSGSELAAADAADGIVDEVIDLDNVNEQAASYQFIGGDGGDFAGTDISSAGDVDGDGLDDLLIGASGADGDPSGSQNEGEAYLILSSDLAAADAADGTVDGVIDLANVSDQAGSYQFLGSGSGIGDDAVGSAVSSAGDVDGDGLDDLLIGAPDSDPNNTTFEGTTYLITAADLADADAADGTVDGVIDLASVEAQGGSYQFNGGSFDEELGFDVSSIGDINNDGFDDLLIGARDGDVPGTIDAGAAYFVSGASLGTLDAADGTTDGVIDLEGSVGQPGLIRFAGTSVTDNASEAVASGGDADGDGVADLLIGAPNVDDGGQSNVGSVYLVSGSEFAAADGADGTVDGRVDLANVAAQSDSYQIIGTNAGESIGLAVSFTEDVDGDDRSDILFGSGANNETYLIASSDLAAADFADGTTDGVISLDNVAGQANSYVFTGFSPGDVAGFAVNSAGDVDGDGIGDLLIGAVAADGGGDASGETYLISGADLGELDALDGTSDGVIDLGLVRAFDDTITVDVNDDGDGTVTGTRVTGTDTVTSVEEFIAGEHPDEADTITITDTGTGYTIADISGLDDNAEGVFTPADGAPAISFGPSTGTMLSDVIDSIENGPNREGGTFQITGGDEDGQVGSISFQNFETVNFAVVCFARGTEIATRNGLVAIEDLVAGDPVMTMDHGFRAIRWIGSRKLDTIDLKNNPKLRPIRISAGALGHGLPEQDLVVSPQHRILVRSVIAQRMFGQSEVLVAANKLLALDGFKIDEDATSVEYYHMLFDEHEIVFSNGAPTESLFTGPEALKAVAPEAREEIVCLFPEIVDADFEPVAARLIPEYGRMAKKLAKRHQSNNKPLLAMED